MIDLPEYIWEDIEGLIAEDVTPFIMRRTVNSRAVARAAVDRIIEIVDHERGRQRRESVGPSRPKEATQS